TRMNAAAGGSEQQDPADHAESSENLLYNGGFESENFEMGFGWILSYSDPAVRWYIDNSVYHTGHRSARVDFDGSSNYDYRSVRQIFAVEPGRHYEATAWMKAEKITGGTGVQFAVSDRLPDHDNAARALFQTQGWEQQKVVFTAPPNIYTMMVYVLRR